MNNNIVAYIFAATIVLIGIISTAKSKYGTSSKYSKYSICSRVFCEFGIAFIIFITFITIGKRLSLSTSSEADGFTIEKYKVILNVNESNIVDVEEDITVNFTESEHRGIYRTIPEWLKYTNKNGTTQSRKYKISNLKSLLEQYSVSSEDGKEKIKIGDPNKTLDIGEHDYKISYKYDMGNDPYNGFDELILHAFGDYWGTKINNASLEIHLPKSFNNNNIKFFGDKYRKNDITKFVDYYIEDNTIYANVKSHYPLEKSLTVDIELPDGYFVNSNNTYSYWSLSLCIICIVAAIVIIILWKKHGKDLDKFSETVEFYPPENLDAAEIGYINKNDTGKKITIALIVELASKGYIKIIEDAKESKQTIVKTNETDKSKMTKNEEIVYNKLFEESDEIDLSTDKTFYKVFDEVANNVRSIYDDKVNDVKSQKYKLVASICFFTCVICFYFAYCIFEDMDPKYNFLYLIAVISDIAILIFTKLMERKNQYGEQMKAKINGFKNYLETAEKYQIDSMVEKNPNYFYDILPYAYVLGVSKKWVEKFENIPTPVNDMGNFDYSNIDSLDSLSSSIYSLSSSGGSSSCGGGCSSCGGGGSW